MLVIGDTMCGNCYEKFLKRSGKVMLFCKLLEKEHKNEMEQLCICQRYCSDKDKYIPHQQKERCKDYE